MRKILTLATAMVVIPTAFAFAQPNQDSNTYFKAYAGIGINGEFLTDGSPNRDKGRTQDSTNFYGASIGYNLTDSFSVEADISAFDLEYNEDNTSNTYDEDVNVYSVNVLYTTNEVVNNVSFFGGAGVGYVDLEKENSNLSWSLLVGTNYRLTETMSAFFQVKHTDFDAGNPYDSASVGIRYDF